MKNLPDIVVVVPTTNCRGLVMVHVIPPTKEAIKMLPPKDAASFSYCVGFSEQKPGPLTQ